MGTRPYTVLAIALLAGCSGATLHATAGPPRDPRLTPVAWLAGCWRGRTSDGVVEETWTVATAGSMLGTGRVLANDRTVFFEFLRIETRGDGLAYVAQPRGGASTTFVLAVREATVLDFENPEHDFPRRIRYTRRDRDTLDVRLDGVEAGTPRTETLSLSRVPCD